VGDEAVEQVGLLLSDSEGGDTEMALVKNKVEVTPAVGRVVQKRLSLMEGKTEFFRMPGARGATRMGPYSYSHLSIVLIIVVEAL
jgi:hypothetical protein